MESCHLIDGKEVWLMAGANNLTYTLAHNCETYLLEEPHKVRSNANNLKNRNARRCGYAEF